MSGMSLLGLLIGFIALVCAIVFFFIAKPRKGSPNDNFLNFDVKKEVIYENEEEEEED